LDTDTIVFLLRGNRSVASKIRDVGDENVVTSTINLAELYFGAFSSNRIDDNLGVIDAFRQSVRMMVFDSTAAVLFGKLKATLKQQRNPLNDSDLLIAAIAISTDSILVTNNIRHFKPIESLQWENWVSE
jgi:tRNA(fMet)-specific endonuclease VapC